MTTTPRAATSGSRLTPTHRVGAPLCCLRVPPNAPHSRRDATPARADPNSTTEVPTIGDIPDLDDDDEPSSSPLDGVSSSLARTSLSGGGAAKDPDAVPDLDDIPDMDDDDVGGAGLVEEDEDDAAVVQPEPPSSRYVAPAPLPSPLLRRLLVKG